jgi:Na+-transporting methylmalonyl-CoA/oxaloacetate decarboxylase gamma subunit
MKKISFLLLLVAFLAACSNSVSTFTQKEIVDAAVKNQSAFENKYKNKDIVISVNAIIPAAFDQKKNIYIAGTATGNKEISAIFFFFDNAIDMAHAIEPNKNIKIKGKFLRIEDGVIHIGNSQLVK